MPSSMSNAPPIHNDRENPFSLDKATAIKAPLHFGTGFGPAKGGWNNSIWASSGGANAFTDGAGDLALSPDQNSLSIAADQSFGGKTGSASLWSTSESDGWNGRTGLPWSASSTQASPAMSRNSSHNISPMRQRKNEQGATIMDLNGSSLPLPPTNRPNFGQMADPTAHGSKMDSMSGLAPKASTGISYPRIDDPRPGQRPSLPISSAGFGGPAFVSSASSANHFTDPAGGYPVRDCTVFQPSGASRERANEQTGSEFRPRVVPATTGIPHHAASRASRWPFCSTDTYVDNQLQDTAGDRTGGHECRAFELDKLNPQGMDPHSQRSRSNRRPTLSSHLSYESTVEPPSRPAVSTDRFPAGPVANMAETFLGQVFDPSSVYQRSTAENCATSPSSIGQPRHEPSSPFYRTAPSPPTISNPLRSSSIRSQPSPSPMNQMAMLERKLRGLHPYQTDHQFIQPHLLQLGSPMPMNPLARPYAMPAYSTYSAIPTGPGHPVRDRRAEHESAQVARSPLLEDFRTNSKTNRRCELRDVYNHVVEFSGDQYGSRFIQQKLETANSDEKEQIFGEILPNAVQLMTDIFGNYVIQKLFEHGNQTQKKILANQMKGRVLALSMQPFGCRVVQKALEHVLVDQQACIVKELENHVLKCVNDQNGNHVIQKAVERVPGRHVQFIINAFKEQIHRLATHAYGCRVIQRMLEHCDDGAQRSILDELLGCVPTLIFDQFGNYVIQHVIVNGAEEDRSKIIAVVISRLFPFSKHKFASNVVEKSIDYGEAGQRAEILRLLTTPNEQRGNPALALVGDSYGNYVIQKVLGHLQGAERESLVEQIRAHMVHLRRNNNPKQVAAIEKLIYCIETDSNPNASSQSSSLPSTNASTVEGPAGILQPITKIGSEQANTPTPASTLHQEPA